MNSIFEQFANKALDEVAVPTGFSIRADDGRLIFTQDNIGLKTAESILAKHSPNKNVSYSNSWIITAMEEYVLLQLSFLNVELETLRQKAKKLDEIQQIMDK